MASEGGPGAVPAMADTEVGPPGIALSPRTPDVNANAPQKLHGGHANRVVTLWLTGCIQSEDNFEERM